MSFSLRRVRNGLVGMWLALHASAAVAQEPAPNAPDHLVLRFDPSAANLNQGAIYAAVAEEVHVIVADEGSEQAATLTVSVTSGGDIRLTYRPAHETVARTIPITNTSNVPRLIGHLAGNMVRDEASALLADIQPNATPSATPARAPAAPASEQPATITIRPHTLDPWRNDPDTGNDAPYLQDKWITTVMIGGAIDALPQARLALHQTKRFDRLEVGVGVQLDLGRVHTNASDSAAYQFTVPLSAEYRVLGGRESYLQLGTSFGLRVGQLLASDFGTNSSTHATLAVDLHVTAGFATGRNQGIVVRAGIGVLPNRFHVDSYSSDVEAAVDPMFPTIQLGYQAGW